MRLLLLAAVCVGVFAQDAVIVRIDLNDAAKVDAKHRAYIAAKAEYEKELSALKEKYVANRVGASSPSSFPCGVDFSAGFLFAVPSQCSGTIRSYYGPAFTDYVTNPAAIKSAN